MRTCLQHHRIFEVGNQLGGALGNGQLILVVRQVRAHVVLSTVYRHVHLRAFGQRFFGVDAQRARKHAIAVGIRRLLWVDPFDAINLRTAQAYIKLVVRLHILVERHLHIFGSRPRRGNLGRFRRFQLHFHARLNRQHVQPFACGILVTVLAYAHLVFTCGSIPCERTIGTGGLRVFLLIRCCIPLLFLQAEKTTARPYGCRSSFNWVAFQRLVHRTRRIKNQRGADVVLSLACSAFSVLSGLFVLLSFLGRVLAHALAICSGLIVLVQKLVEFHRRITMKRNASQIGGKRALADNIGRSRRTLHGKQRCRCACIQHKPAVLRLNVILRILRHQPVTILLGGIAFGVERLQATLAVAVARIFLLVVQNPVVNALDFSLQHTQLVACAIPRVDCTLQTNRLQACTNNRQRVPPRLAVLGGACRLLCCLGKLFLRFCHRLRRFAQIHRPYFCQAYFPTNGARGGGGRRQSGRAGDGIAQGGRRFDGLVLQVAQPVDQISRRIKPDSPSSVFLPVVAVIGGLFQVDGIACFLGLGTRVFRGRVFCHHAGVA